MNIFRHTLLTYKVVALAIVSATTLYSCSQRENGYKTIFTNSLMTVTEDSIGIHGKKFVKTISSTELVCGNDTIAVSEPANYPAFHSSIPVIDAAFVKGMNVCHSILADSVQPHLIDCLELLALINPEECISKLATMVSDSIVAAPSPAYTGRGLWIIAAAEAGKATGNREWLSTVRSIGKRTLDMEHEVAYSPQHSLLRGIPMTHMGENDYLPRWMNEIDRFERFTLMSNVVSAGAYRVMGSTETECNRSNPIDWQERARRLSHTINIRLWQPDAGMYNRFLYTGIYPIPARITDNAAQPLAILFGIAVPEMADKILASTPWYQVGMPLFYPSPAGSPLINFTLAYPRVQALWALAAAQRGNESVICAALGSLLAQSLGSASDSIASLQVAMCAMRVFCGISIADEGLEFNPVVPEFLKDGFELTGLKYRDSELTVKVKGSGNRIAHFYIDGAVTATHRLDASLNGKHTITITMAGNTLTKNELPTRQQEWTPPVPEIDYLSPRICKIEGIIPKEVKYILYRNGSFYSMINSNEFHLPDSDGFSEFCVIPVAKGSIQGFCSAPYYYTPAGCVKTLQAEDFAPGGTLHIRDWRPSFRYVESTPKTNSLIEFTVKINEAARYVARICYANGNGAVESGDACALRSVKVNGNPAGTFVLPARGDGWWLSSGFSNSLILSLDEGENRITVEYNPKLYPGNSSTDVLIDYLRLIQL